MYIAGNHPGGLEGLLCSFPGMWHAKYMRWTTEPPEQGGWFWASIRYASGRYQRIIFIDKNQTYYAPVDWDDERREHISQLGEDVYWLGPLPVPEPPTESE